MSQQPQNEIGGRNAQQLLDPQHSNRRRTSRSRLKVSVCAGTNCYVKGSQRVLRDLLQCVETEQLQERVEVSVRFCFQDCGQGPTVRIGDQELQHCTGPQALAALQAQLKAQAPPE